MSLRAKNPLCLISLIALLVILADQLSKWAIIKHVFQSPQTGGFMTWLAQVAPRESFPPLPLIPSFNLVMVWNRGVSFGMFQNHDTMMPYILSVLGLAVCAGFLIWARHTSSRLMQTATGLIVGGALGNIWDRLRFGAVADFFDFYIGSYHWPAFNIADCAISVGVVALLIHLMLEKPVTPVHVSTE